MRMPAIPLEQVHLGQLHRWFTGPSTRPTDPRPTAAEIQGGDTDHRARLALVFLAALGLAASALFVRGGGGPT